MRSIAILEPFGKKANEVNAIVETPKGSLNKFDYDQMTGLFRLGAAMPAGVVFPFEFGFIPQTLGEDGDPLDLLILMDAPSFVGCHVLARVVGVIEAKQTEEKQTIRNDRLIAVAVHSRRHEGVRSLKELSKQLIDEVEYFFVSYNKIKERKFEPLGRFGPRRAMKLIGEAVTRLSRTGG